MPISQWSTTPATNASSATGINWAEGQLPSTVNDSARQLMADVRAWMDDGGWHNWGDTHTYSGGTATLVSGDVTARYHANRSVRAVGSSTGTIYGKIASSSYGAPNTTINYTWDSGSLVNETLTISLGFSAVTGKPLSANGVRGVGTGDLLSTNNLSDVSNAATAFGNIKQAATETASGVLEIATAAETTTGTDDTRAITPLKLTTFAPASATFDSAADELIFRDASDNLLKRGALSGVGLATRQTDTTDIALGTCASNGTRVSGSFTLNLVAGKKLRISMESGRLVNTSFSAGGSAALGIEINGTIYFPTCVVNLAGTTTIYAPCVSRVGGATNDYWDFASSVLTAANTITNTSAFGGVWIVEWDITALGCSTGSQTCYFRMGRSTDTTYTDAMTLKGTARTSVFHAEVI